MLLVLPRHSAGDALDRVVSVQDEKAGYTGCAQGNTRVLHRNIHLVYAAPYFVESVIRCDPTTC